MLTPSPIKSANRPPRPRLAQMDADAKYDSCRSMRQQASIAFDRAVLRFDRAAHRLTTLPASMGMPVAGALDDLLRIFWLTTAKSIRSLRWPRRRRLKV